MGISSLEELQKLEIRDFHTEKTNQLIKNIAMPQVIATGKWTGETELKTKEGKVIPVLQTIISHKNEQGEITKFSTTAIDISELKQQQQQVALLNATIENANAYVSICDLEGNYIYINPAMKAALAIADDTDVTTISVRQFGSEESKRLIANKTPELFINKNGVVRMFGSRCQAGC